jgi:hypothetical protein
LWKYDAFFTFNGAWRLTGVHHWPVHDALSNRDELLPLRCMLMLQGVHFAGLLNVQNILLSETGNSRQTEGHSFGDHLISNSVSVKPSSVIEASIVLCSVSLTRVSQCPISLRAEHLIVILKPFLRHEWAVCHSSVKREIGPTDLFIVDKVVTIYEAHHLQKLHWFWDCLPWTRW